MHLTKYEQARISAHQDKSCPQYLMQSNIRRYLAGYIGIACVFREGVPAESEARNRFPEIVCRPCPATLINTAIKLINIHPIVLDYLGMRNSAIGDGSKVT